MQGGELLFCSLARDTLVQGSNPQAFVAEPPTPTHPQIASAPSLSSQDKPPQQGHPGSHWRAVICQSKVGEKRNTPPPKPRCLV